jgi:quinol monooxygenase YgiN
MLVVRFKVLCKPEKVEALAAGLREVIAPSRRVEGVVHFDIGRDLSDPSALIATEVFEDRAALERQEALPEVAKALELFEESLAAEPEATIFNVSSSEPWGG